MIRQTGSRNPRASALWGLASRAKFRVHGYSGNGFEDDLFCGEFHRTAVCPAELSFEAYSQCFRGFLVAAHACAAEDRSSLGLGQSICFCLFDYGFYASASVQFHHPESIACLNVIVAVEGLAHALR